MVIGIDAGRYHHQTKTGVEYYSKHIIDGLMELAKRRQKHQLLLYAPNSLGLNDNNSKWIKEKIIRSPRLWTQFRLSLEMFLKKPEVLFIPSHTLPIIHPKKTVVTIHDTAFRYFKNSYSKWQYLHLEFTTKMAVKKASKIIVPSEATKKDLIGFYHCPAEKIEVIYHGVPEIYKEKISEKVNKEILNKFGLQEGDNYMFFVGRLESKKNLKRLLEAFDAFAKKYDHWKLILGGKRGLGFKEIHSFLQTLSTKNQILMPGYLDEQEKAVLMKNSRLFVFPSLYEGFGLPVLEAFQAGIPVVCSGVSALREIAFDAAYLVNPLDSDEIQGGLEKVAFDEDLRASMIAKGQERVKSFDWGKAARKTWSILTDRL